VAKKNKIANFKAMIEDAIKLTTPLINVLSKRK
jgi:hypothetical protein